MPFILHEEADTIEELKLKVAKILGDWPKHPNAPNLGPREQTAEPAPIGITSGVLAGGRGGTGPAIETPSLETQSTVTVETIQEPKAETAAPTDIPDYDTVVKPKVLAVSAKHGRAGVEKLLEPFGVQNAKHLKPEQYGPLLEAADKMLEG